MTTASNALGQNKPRKLLCILFTALIMTIAAAGADHTGKMFQMRSDNSSIGMHNQKTGTITCQPEVPNTASVCYDIYGELEEFSLESPWSSVTPAMRNTKFWLTSSPDQERPLVLNPNNTAELTNAPLNVEGKVYALVHDWNTGGKWTKLLRRELIRAVSSNNVVVVRWSNDTYSQSVANIRVVARQLAFFISRLQVLRGIPSHSFHLVGHGLGAHLCGIAGTYLQQRYGITVQRITGLDPIQPGFTTEENFTRLDHSDASFVDVIHTDSTRTSNILITPSMEAAIGHLDFYPVSGVPQLRCMAERPHCSHPSALQLFIKSVRQDCSFLAVRCASKEMFLKGECWGCKPPNECSAVGLQANPMELPPNSKFFTLNSFSRYCAYHYLVSITLGDINGWEVNLRSLALIGTSGTSNNIHLTSEPAYSTAGSVHRYVLLARSLGQLRLVTVSLTYRRLSASDVSMGLQESRLFLSKVSVQMLGSESLTEFCFNGASDERNVQYVTLTADDICSSTTETVLPPAKTTGSAATQIATPLPLVGDATAPVATTSSEPQVGAATIGVAPTAGAVDTESGVRETVDSLTTAETVVRSTAFVEPLSPATNVTGFAVPTLATEAATLTSVLRLIASNKIIPTAATVTYVLPASIPQASVDTPVTAAPTEKLTTFAGATRSSSDEMSALQSQARAATAPAAATVRALTVAPPLTSRPRVSDRTAVSNIRSNSCQPGVSVCYDIYGVKEEFPVTYPWTGIIPTAPAELDTAFLLTTKAVQDHPLKLNLSDVEVLKRAPFNPDGRLIILVHGFEPSGRSSDWAEKMKSELLKADSSINVVIVDWSKGAVGAEDAEVNNLINPFAYLQAIENSRVVARELASFMNSLQELHGIPSSNIELIGHSLGAHLCGMAGADLQQRYGNKVQTITGLDPAKQWFEGKDPITRLDPSDAGLVFVIHTNTNLFGIKDPIGHIDLYPNGGESQPLCPILGCSHSRAHKLFMQSVERDCPLVAVRCPSYEMFSKGECRGCQPPYDCVELGINFTVPKNLSGNSTYFMNDSSLDCEHEYQVTITMSNIPRYEFQLDFLTIKGTIGKIGPEYLKSPNWFPAGSTRRYLIRTKSLGYVRSIEIIFNYKSNSRHNWVSIIAETLDNPITSTHAVGDAAGPLKPQSKYVSSVTVTRQRLLP